MYLVGICQHGIHVAGIREENPLAHVGLEPWTKEFQQARAATTEVAAVAAAK